MGSVPCYLVRILDHDLMSPEDQPPKPILIHPAANERGMTELHFAAYCNDAEAVASLLNGGATVGHRPPPASSRPARHPGRTGNSPKPARNERTPLTRLTGFAKEILPVPSSQPPVPIGLAAALWVVRDGRRRPTRLAGCLQLDAVGPNVSHRNVANPHTDRSAALRPLPLHMNWRRRRLPSALSSTARSKRTVWPGWGVKPSVAKGMAACRR